MNAIRLILLSFALSFGCSYMTMPTDFSTVASGTRANLAANFSEAENKFNPCADSVAQVRARLSNYTTSLTVTSLENLRLRLDGDATATGIFLVEGSSGDSLFRVSENLNARLFGHVAIDSNLTARKVTAADTVVAAHLKSGGSLSLTGNASVAKLTASDSVLAATLNVSGLTASRLMSTNAGKTAASVSDLTSWIAGTANQITSTSDGDGTLTLSLPQNIHTGANPTFAGATLSGDLALSATDGYVRSNTSDGADNKRISLSGGGAVDAARGAIVSLFGNEHATAPGALHLRAGTIGTGDITLYTNGAARLTIANGGTSTFSGPLVASSTLGVTGLQSNSEAIAFTANGTGGAGRIYRSATNGVSIRGVTGSTNDFALVDAANNTIARNPTGTTDMVFHGLLTASSGASFTGGTSGAGKIWTGATSGLNLQGITGGTNDFALNSAAGSIILRNPTGTTGLSFPTAPTFESVTASQFLLVDGSKALTSVAGTGSGSVVRQTGASLTSPTLTTPAIGAATGTSLNLTGNLTADSIVSTKFYQEGSFTVTLQGCATAPTGTARYVRVGKQVTLTFPTFLSGTSDSVGLALTGLPANLAPNGSAVQIPGCNIVDNGVHYFDANLDNGNYCVISTAATIDCLRSGGSTNFTASGTKAFGSDSYATACRVTYTLQ